MNMNMDDVNVLSSIIYKNNEIINILIVFMSLKNKIKFKMIELENIFILLYSLFK